MMTFRLTSSPETPFPDGSLCLTMTTTRMTMNLPNFTLADTRISCISRSQY